MIATADELIDHLRIDRNDLRTDALTVWNDTADQATATVTSTALVLYRKVGATGYTDTLLFATYATIAALVSAVEALGNGWAVDRVCSGSVASNTLCQIGATNVKSYASRQTLLRYDIDWLTRCVSSSQAFLERICRRAFESVEYKDDRYSGDGANLLVLRNYPVTKLTSIKRITAVSGGVETLETEDSDDYRLDATNGLVWHDTEWIKGRRNYVVVYTAGYESVPGDLKVLCLDLAAMYYHQTGRDPLLREERLGPYSRRFFETPLPPELEARLALFRRSEDAIE